MSASEINEIKQLAIDTLEGVCRDPDAPAAAKAAAARTLAEITAMIGRNSVADALATKSLTEMSASELDAEIQRMTQNQPQ
jgi:hypothetical protein